MESSSRLLVMLRAHCFALWFQLHCWLPSFHIWQLHETLPLQKGSRLYELQGLKSNSWYEVKISYPASIPASFPIQLKKDVSDLGSNRNRRLLNTEKLIFKADSFNGSPQNKLYCLGDCTA